MFTGLVEALGIVRAISPEGDSCRLQVAVPPAFLEAASPEKRLGDSVAINGCCLTVVAADVRIATNETLWSFQAGHETLARTNLGRLQIGDAVNLERAMPANGRFGGHIVQGHVDGVGKVAVIAQRGDWSDYTFEVPEHLAAQMVEKGSITVDGVSLTLTKVDQTRFQVMLIPHTLAVTTLGQRKVGDEVNLETDVLAKYVQKLMSRGSVAGGSE
ncbi:MAG: riboflavin synthase [Planctomycetia bacterium]|nr:riboflavin synthase [Planctomycetia bacterium]